MKTKSVLSSLILLAFAVLGGGSIDENGNFEPWFWVVIIFVVVVIIIAGVSSSQEEAKRKERAELERLKRAERLKAKTEEYNKIKQQFIALHGTPDKSMSVKELDFNSEIHVYERAKRVFILGKEYAFKDIMSCTFSDTPVVIKGKMTAITKSKNGDVIGRSIVGDLVAGPAGAVIGGTTAKKNTEYFQEPDKTVHDYTVIINVNSISNPIIRIHTGNDGKLTNEIVGLLNVIISRK